MADVSQLPAGSGVKSFNSRTGAVTPQSGDYTAAQVTNAADKSSVSTQAFTGSVTPAADDGASLGTHAARWGQGWFADFVSLGSAPSPGGSPPLIRAYPYSSLITAVYVQGATDQSANLITAVDVSSNPLFSVSATGLLASKGAALNPIASGALPTVSPVSGTAFQCSTSRDVYLVVPVTYTLVASTCKVELSPDNTTFSTLVTVDPGVAGAVDSVQMFVPAAWYVKLTTSNATLGTGTYY